MHSADHAAQPLDLYTYDVPMDKGSSIGHDAGPDALRRLPPWSSAAYRAMFAEAVSAYLKGQWERWGVVAPHTDQRQQ